MKPSIATANKKCRGLDVQLYHVMISVIYITKDSNKLFSYKVITCCHKKLLTAYNTYWNPSFLTQYFSHKQKVVTLESGNKQWWKYWKVKTHRNWVSPHPVSICLSCNTYFIENFQLLSLCRQVQLSIFINANEHERKPWCGDRQLDRCHMKHSEDDYPSQCGDTWHVLDSSDTLENIHQEAPPASQQSALQTTASQNNVGTKMCTSSIVFARWHQTIGSAIFVQLTAESLYTLQWVPLSPKLPVSMGDLDPHLTHYSLGPSKPRTQTAPCWFNRFCTDDLRVSLYFTIGCPSPSKLPLSMGGSEPHLNGSLGHLSPQPKQHLDWFSRFCRAH